MDGSSGTPSAEDTRTTGRARARVSLDGIGTKMHSLVDDLALPEHPEEKARSERQHLGLG